MPGDDLNLRAVIETALDGEGFEQFKARLGEMSTAAGAASQRTEGLGRGMSELERHLPRAGVRLLTAELLSNAGALGVGGRATTELARAASYLALGLGPLGLAIGVVGAAAALAVGHIQAKKEADEKAATAAKEHAQAVQGEISQLEDLKRTTGRLTPALAELLAAKLAITEESRRTAIVQKTEELLATRQQIQALKDQERIMDERIAQMAKEAGLEGESLKRTSAESGEIAKLSIRERELTAELKAEREARAAGTRSIEDHIGAIKREAAAMAEATRKKGRDFDRYVDNIISGNRGMEEDEKKFLKEHEKDRRKEVQIDENAEIRLQAIERARARLLRDRFETEREYHQFQADQVAASFAAAATLFSKNKAINIAAALVDTYAAANKALNNPPGPPWTIPFAALAIAQGLANVQRIREADAGFDSPVNDMLARAFGEKWAQDALSNIGAGFYRALDGIAPGGGTVYNQQRSSTTIYRGGVHAGAVNVSGMFGAGKTNLLKQLNRELIKIQRLEDRTRLG